MAEPLFSGRKVAQGSALPSGRPNCAKCGLKKGREPGGLMGRGGEGILFLTDAPSTRNKEALSLFLQKQQHNLESDCWILPAVACRPKDGKPTGIHIECCRPVVFDIIKKLQPKKIIALGGTPLESLLGHRWTHEQLGKLARWRGHRTPDRDLRSWLYVTYNPSYISGLDKKDRATINTFKRDIRNAIRHTNSPVDWDYDPEKHVKILTDAREIKKAIRKYRKSGELVGFDYEGTGLKPHAKGHEIYSASMATPSLGAVSFPMYSDIIPSWIKFLTSDVPKTAHNIKFEDGYARELLGAETKNWVLCTMQGAHVLDNRKGVASLEFQAYTRLGFLPWGMDIKRYFKAASFSSTMLKANIKQLKGTNTINNIKKAPIRSVLLYGGLDSLAQVMLAHLPEYKELWLGQ